MLFVLLTDARSKKAFIYWMINKRLVFLLESLLQIRWIRNIVVIIATTRKRRRHYFRRQSRQGSSGLFQTTVVNRNAQGFNADTVDIVGFIEHDGTFRSNIFANEFGNFRIQHVLVGHDQNISVFQCLPSDMVRTFFSK